MYPTWFAGITTLASSSWYTSSRWSRRTLDTSWPHWSFDANTCRSTFSLGSYVTLRSFWTRWAWNTWQASKTAIARWTDLASLTFLQNRMSLIEKLWISIYRIKAVTDRSQKPRREQKPSPINNMRLPWWPILPGGPGRPGLPRPGIPGGPWSPLTNSSMWSMIDHHQAKKNRPNMKEQSCPSKFHRKIWRQTMLTADKIVWPSHALNGVMLWSCCVLHFPLSIT